MRPNKCIITHFIKYGYWVYKRSGPGLGNLLFPIEERFRRLILKKFLFAYHVKFKLGPLIRQEKDLRLYNKEFKKRNYNDYEFSRVFF